MPMPNHCVECDKPYIEVNIEGGSLCPDCSPSKRGRGDYRGEGEIESLKDNMMSPMLSGNGNPEIDDEMYEERPLVTIEIDRIIYHIDPEVDALINNLVLQIKELQELSGSGGFKSN
jgi:hypothetical protein